MKNNNKGFFLAEAIVMITLVTVVMAYVYPNVSNLYGNFKNRTKYWDQPEDIYALKNIKNDSTCISDMKNATSDLSNNLSNNLSNKLSNDLTNCHGTAYFDKTYVTKYLSNPEFTGTSAEKSMEKSFNEYLKKMKRTTNDPDAYRLIGVIGDGTKPYRYVSIKVDAEDLNQGE